MFVGNKMRHIAHGVIKAAAQRTARQSAFSIFLLSAAFLTRLKAITRPTSGRLKKAFMEG